MTGTSQMGLVENQVDPDIYEQDQAAISPIESMEKPIRIQRIMKTYPNKFTAIKNVSCFVPKRGIFGLLGPNGAG